MAYTVTLQHTDTSGDLAAATASGTTDASGEFTQAITIPEDVTAGEAASISASVECSGGSQQTNTVPVTIEAWEGTLEITPGSGERGTEAAIMGSNCYGFQYGEVIVTFGSEGDADPEVVEGIEAAADRTFSGTYTVPAETAPGRYTFAASCPGTTYAPVTFTVVGPTPATTSTTVTTTFLTATATTTATRTTATAPTTPTTQAAAPAGLVRTGTPLAPLVALAILLVAAGYALITGGRVLAPNRPAHRHRSGS